MVGLTLYQLLKPAIGLNDDGTQTINTTPDNYTATYSFNACTAYHPIKNYSGTTSSICSGFNSDRNTAYSTCGYGSPDGSVIAGAQGHCKYSGGSQNGTEVGGLALSAVSPGSQTKIPTEAELATSISASSIAAHELFAKQMADSIVPGNGIDFGHAVLPVSTSATVTASPVTGPLETISISTSPNPDGSTSTTTKKQQTTATPTPKGSTLADSGVDWATSTSETTTVTNNTTNVSTTTTTNNYDGTTTTKAETDLCKLHPTAAACLELGSLPTDTTPTVTSQPLNVSFSPPTSVAGSCPAPVTRSLTHGKTVTMSFQPTCDFASMMRPVIIAAAFLGAAFIVSGSVRVDS